MWGSAAPPLLPPATARRSTALRTSHLGRSEDSERITGNSDVTRLRKVCRPLAQNRSNMLRSDGRQKPDCHTTVWALYLERHVDYCKSDQIGGRLGFPHKMTASPHFSGTKMGRMISFLRAYKRGITYSLVSFCAFWPAPRFREAGPFT